MIIWRFLCQKHTVESSLGSRLRGCWWRSSSLSLLCSCALVLLEMNAPLVLFFAKATSGRRPVDTTRIQVLVPVRYETIPDAVKSEAMPRIQAGVVSVRWRVLECVASCGVWGDKGSRSSEPITISVQTVFDTERTVLRTHNQFALCLAGIPEGASPLPLLQAFNAPS